MHHIMIIMLSMHLLSRVVNLSEEVVATTDPVSEECPPFEVGFDICGPSEESDNPNTEGKPRSINPFLVFYKH